MTPQSRRTQQLRRRRAGVEQLVTQAQMVRLNHLAATRWQDGWEQALEKLCRRMIRRAYPATTIQANKVIEALKAMNAREGK